jgi:pimeloyl-ACP methyl ester carboxylesterase
MKEEKIQIPRSNGKTLAAIHYQTEQPKNSTPMVIMCHGFSGDKSEWGRFPRTAERLNTEGYDVVTFDFSGSGENPREIVNLTKQVKDLEDVFEWVKNQGYINISTIGLSFGGVTSLLAKLPERKCAVFWAPAFFIEKIAGRMGMFGGKLLKIFKKIRIKIKSSGDYPKIEIDYTYLDDVKKSEPEKHLAEFTQPSLIVQGVEDSTVKVEYSREAIALMPQDELHKLVEIANTDHDFSGEYLEQFIDHSLDWLNKFGR